MRERRTPTSNQQIYITKCHFSTESVDRSCVRACTDSRRIKLKRQKKKVADSFQGSGRIDRLANCPLLCFKRFIVIIINIDDNDEMILREIIARMQRETS